MVVMKKNLGFHLWAEVEVVGKALLQQLEKNHPGKRFSLTGDIRRQNETVEFIEFVTDLDKASIANAGAAQGALSSCRQRTFLPYFVHDHWQ